MKYKKKYLIEQLIKEVGIANGMISIKVVNNKFNRIIFTVNYLGKEMDLVESFSAEQSA